MADKERHQPRFTGALTKEFDQTVEKKIVSLLEFTAEKGIDKVTQYFDSVISSLWSRLIHGAIVILPFVLVGGGCYLLRYYFAWRRDKREEKESTRKSKEHIQDEAAKKLATPFRPSEKFLTIIENHYITREKEENEVKQALQTTAIEETFYIMLGNRGCGKSTLVNKVINGLLGIVVVPITKVLQPDEIGWAILKSMDINQTDVGAVDPLRYFVNICKKSKARVKVIFEVSRRTSKDAFFEIINTAKWISCDEGIAVCIINISSSLVLVDEIEPRIKYIYVGAFTEFEANLFLDQMELVYKKTFDTNSRTIVFEKYGTHPLALLQIAQLQLGSPEEYIDSYVCKCVQEIKDTLKGNSKFLDLYKQMLCKPLNEGMECGEANDLVNLQTTEVGNFIRKFHVIAYVPQIPSKYVFHSQAMMKAAQLICLERPVPKTQ